MNYLVEARRQMSAWTDAELQNVVDAPNDPGEWTESCDRCVVGQASGGHGTAMADRYGYFDEDGGHRQYWRFIYWPTFHGFVNEALGAGRNMGFPAVAIAFYKHTARSILDERMLNQMAAAVPVERGVGVA